MPYLDKYICIKHLFLDDYIHLHTKNLITSKKELLLFRSYLDIVYNRNKLRLAFSCLLVKK
jgi:hypothetical protein